MIALLIPKTCVGKHEIETIVEKWKERRSFFQVIEPLFYSSRIIGGVVYNIIFSSCKKEEMMLDHY